MRRTGPPHYPPPCPEPTPPAPGHVELMGIGVMVTVLERMSPDERRRSLAYLTDRYAGHPPLRSTMNLPTTPPEGPGLDDDAVAKAVGESAALVGLWRAMSMTWHRDGNTVLTWSGGKVVGRQEVTDDGSSAGPYIVIVNELTDEEIAERDRDR